MYTMAAPMYVMHACRVENMKDIAHDHNTTADMAHSYHAGCTCLGDVAGETTADSSGMNRRRLQCTMFVMRLHRGHVFIRGDIRVRCTLQRATSCIETSGKGNNDRRVARDAKPFTTTRVLRMSPRRRRYPFIRTERQSPHFYHG
jgi:hypothetical protein